MYTDLFGGPRRQNAARAKKGEGSSPRLAQHEVIVEVLPHPSVWAESVDHMLRSLSEHVVAPFDHVVQQLDAQFPISHFFISFCFFICPSGQV